MSTLMQGLRHIHLRKRRYHKNMKKYPNNDPKIKRLDDSMLIIGSMAPLFTLPQIIHIFTTKNVEGLSWLTYLLIGLTNMVWIIYGVVHKDRQIISANTLFLTANTIILSTIFIY
ncbi:MAG: SemiSWEET family sugar transporter [Candidatus Woesearchaeota archaeon]